MLEGGAEGLDEAGLGGLAAEGVEVFADEMGEDFGVGLRFEGVAFLHELVLEDVVVLDDAVVADEKFAALVGVRMGVFIGDAAVGGPAGVRDADGACGRGLLDEFGEVRDASDAFADLDFPAVEDGDARGVVAAVFEPAKAVEKDGDCCPGADVADDAAHSFMEWLGMRGERGRDGAMRQGARVAGLESRAGWRSIRRSHDDAHPLRPARHALPLRMRKESTRRCDTQLAPRPQRRREMGAGETPIRHGEGSRGDAV